jgi:hypothetical protein
VRHLPIYLNDHLAGATLAVELARRTRDENAGTELGEFLTWLHVQVAEDRAALLALMKRHGVRRSLGKVAAGWTAEKLGRLKPNGHVTRYSPLSRLVELEGLALGIEGKRALWVALQGADLEQLGELIARADEQRERLEPYRLAAAAIALP